MREMIERAARAIFPTLGGLYDFNGQGFGGYDDPDEEFLRETSQGVARAVLQAIREPSLAMSDAGRDVTGAPPYAPHEITKLGYLQVCMIWQAMIDSALTE